MGEDNILKSIKKMLGLDVEDDSFDIDIIININTTFDFLVQLGVESLYRVYLHTGNEKWSSYMDENQLYRMIITYTYLKVKDYFDPPTSGVLREAMERQIKELEWRIREMAAEMELRKPSGEGGGDDDDSSNEWYNIIRFLQDQSVNSLFYKGMTVSDLTDHDKDFFKSNSLIYPFAANDDKWKLIDDDGDTFIFVCEEGEHAGRDFNLHYGLDSTKKVGWVKEFISTPEYELAQKLLDLPVGGTL